MTIDELINWIDTYADSIPVRVEHEGLWQSLYLTEMPARLAITEVCRFLRLGQVPHRVKDEPELICQSCHDATGGVCPAHAEPECTCYEMTGGHQPGCVGNR